MNIDFAGVQRMDEKVEHKLIIPTEPFPYKPSVPVYSPYPPTRSFRSKVNKDEDGNQK